MPNIFRGNKRRRPQQSSPAINSWTARDTAKPSAKQYHNPYNLKYDKKSTRSCLDMLRGHLRAVKFRELNQNMCQQKSEQNLSLFASAPALFTQYHDGYAYQRAQWKIDPLDAIVRTVPRIREDWAHHTSTRKKSSEEAVSPLTLETSEGTYSIGSKHFVIADLGCGTGKLVEELILKGSAERKEKSGQYTTGSLQCKEKAVHCIATDAMAIFSFDLVATKPFITAADITSLPLPDQRVSLVVLCLSIIGENFLDVLLESYRVLSPQNGTILIAEVASRLKAPQSQLHFVQLMESIGFEKVLISSSLDETVDEGDSVKKSLNVADDAFFIYCTAVKCSDLYTPGAWKNTTGKGKTKAPRVQNLVHRNFVKIQEKNGQSDALAFREWHRSFILGKFQPQKIIAPYHAKKRNGRHEQESETAEDENTRSEKQNDKKHRHSTKSHRRMQSSRKGSGGRS